MYNKILYFALGLIAPLYVSAQTADEGKWSVKAHARIGLGDAMDVNSTLQGMTGETSDDAYGIDFGYRLWQKGRHSLQLNAGLGYNAVSTRLSLPGLNYSYSASAEADMDGEAYTRYTELNDLSQKSQVSRLTVPVYVGYGFRCTSWLTVHADLGVCLGFKTSAKLTDVSGRAYTYGVYPQYDNLMIDADYMNDFGRRELAGYVAEEPEVSTVTASLRAGIGAEFRLYGPLSADVSLLSDTALTDLYTSRYIGGNGFSADTAPLVYTVGSGSRLRSLTGYLTSSKLSHLSLNISLICRF